MEFAVIFAAICGAIWGSFSVAQVWRIRARQLSVMQKTDPYFDAEEFAKLKNLVNISAKTDRSKCLTCDYRLRAWDLVPIFSWLSLRGKCRNCSTPIGWLEFLVEVAAAVFFALIAFLAVKQNLPIYAALALFVAVLPLMILFIYDAKWSLLPTRILWIFVILAGGFFAISNFSKFGSFEIWRNLAISILAFPAIYWALAAFSKEKMVGGGDWILALGLILLLPPRAINGVMMVFFSNFVALAIIIFLAILKKTSIKKGAQIPFGPAMILAWILMMILSEFLVANFGFLM